MLSEQKKIIEMLIANSIKRIFNAAKVNLNNFAMPAVILERPKLEIHGDLSCNIAMQVCKVLDQSPRRFAESIVKTLLQHPSANDLINSAEVAGPGFINLRLSPIILQSVVKNVLKSSNTFGHAQIENGSKIIIEFVSANPTGPLHIGHSRQAALGDAFARLFESQGWKVWREFYYNDKGTQINNLARSVQARARGLKPNDLAWPETGYNGEYICDIAKDFIERNTIKVRGNQSVTASGNIEDIDSIRIFSVAYLQREQDIDLQALGIKFDYYFLESSLFSDKRVEKIVHILIEKGCTYEKQGALWFKSTDYGDDKDRVIRKSDGSYTYFISDIAYHIDKWERGYSRAINVQGMDHHGTIARVRAGLQALNVGIPIGYPDYILHSMVRVQRDGREVKISKRSGNYITVRDIIEWSGGVISGETPTEMQIQRGRDAVRFFMLSRKADTEFIFDIDLAVKCNDENPIYYIQYAHARISSILFIWGGDINILKNVQLSCLGSSTHAMRLIKHLAEFPETLEYAANEFAPHTIIFYLLSLARNLHAFYNAEKVLVEDKAIRLARLALLTATRQVLRNGLDVLGISAPQRMHNTYGSLPKKQ